MEETRKRHGCDSDGDDSGKKRQRAVAELEDMEGLGDDILAWFSTDDEAVSEIMKLLNADKKEPLTSKVRFIDDPYTSPLIFQSSSSYVTINGNEESCGSSFSDSDSSVMASVDMGGVNIPRKLLGMDFEALDKWIESGAGTGDGGEWSSRYEEARVWLEREETSGSDGGVDGCDGFCWDDDAFARFLGDDFFGSNTN